MQRTARADDAAIDPSQAAGKRHNPLAPAGAPIDVKSLRRWRRTPNAEKRRASGAGQKTTNSCTGENRRLAPPRALIRGHPHAFIVIADSFAVECQLLQERF